MLSEPTRANLRRPVPAAYRQKSCPVCRQGHSIVATIEECSRRIHRDYLPGY